MTAQRESLRAILEPQSVAIVGASDDFSKINGRPLKYLLEFKYGGRILPINPKYGEIAGLRCYPNLEVIDCDIDLAIVAVPAKAVSDVLESCAKRGVKSAVVFSSGFAEMGEEGKAAQERIGVLARESGLLVCGPNSLGIANLTSGMTASFSQTLERKPASGPIGFITQSGAFGTFLFGMALESGLTFKYFISSGNEADLEFADYVDYVLDDPEVRVIAGYVEGLKNGGKLKEVARKAASLGKPIVLIKVGRSSAGTRAARSHTGSMTGTDAVYSAAFEELGIVRADTEEQLLDYASAFLSSARLPQGRGVGIVTQSGGAGVLAADRAEMVGLVVPELQDETKKQLLGVVPRFGATGNPVDVTAQFIAEPALLRDSIALVDRDPQVNGMVFCLGLMDLHWSRVAAELTELSKTVTNPLYVSWTAAPSEALEALRSAGIPVFPTPTRTIDALAAATSFNMRREAASQRVFPAAGPAVLPEVVRQLIHGARAQGRDHLLEWEAKQVLAAFGVPVPRGQLVGSSAEALQTAEALGYPVVVKAQAIGLLHKSDARVIELNVANAQQLRLAHARVLARAREHGSPEAIRGILVEEMVNGGLEVITGVSYDPSFGPVLLVGLGGIFTEILRDVALHLCPLEVSEAAQLLQKLRGYQLLTGARGTTKRDLASLYEALAAVSRMAAALEGVAAEIDVNPLLVLPEGQGVKAVDALITLRSR
ncbi:MAG: acetate--CoA ligase family protein [Chloroflexi bacterium]|nr:acetate--CoA ligase family protein [Chloroflexota bacterium]